MIRPDEEATDLILGGYQVLQKRTGYRFSIDAVLLAHFVAPAEESQILDLGTGSGVIPLILAARFAKAQITGMERQPAAAEMAARSVLRNNLAARIQILESDWRHLPKAMVGAFDLVLANPPYFPLGSGRENPDPTIADARHERHGTLADLIAAAAAACQPRGHIAIINRAERLPEALAIFAQNRITPARLRLVHAQVDQPAKLFLLEGRKAPTTPLQILPPLVIYQGRDYHPEIRAYYGGTTHE